MSLITIVNYGLGNLGSIVNMYKRLGMLAVSTSDPVEIVRADKLILPGVGHFDAAMRKIEELGLRDVLDRKVLHEGTPILGICLGMQLLTNGSEEGSLPGLGWIDAETTRFRFPDNPDLKVPHMGWNLVKVSNPSPITQGFDEEFRYYFVHSYNVQVKDSRHSMLRTTYGVGFESGIQRDNIFGVQFHPEKSHKFGMQLLRNFAAL